MTVWTYPAIVTTEPTGSLIGAQLDFGCKLYMAAAVRIAGLRPRPNTTIALELIDLLPVGARILLTAEQADLRTPLQAHVQVGGIDVASHVKGNTAEPVIAEYGGTLAKEWTYPATIVRVIDADTCAVKVRTGSRVDYLTNLRVQHCNAPEHDTAEGDAATVWAERVLTPGMDVTIRSHSLDKYGRLLGSITMPDCADYADLLMRAGHAAPYEGGKR
jgi:micrococcal nuclease